METPQEPQSNIRSLVLAVDNSRVTRENFWKKGHEMIKAMEPAPPPTISRGTPEFEAWAKYFQEHLRWEPWSLKAARTGSIQAMTVPAQWPEWFDPNYARSTT